MCLGQFAIAREAYGVRLREAMELILHLYLLSLIQGMSEWSLTSSNTAKYM